MKEEINGRKVAVFNPNSVAVDDLPIIYGFNNGSCLGSFQSGVLLAEDGTRLGGHACSNEGFMLGDLGILEGTSPDRHEIFKDHYPDGYRMAFVSYSDVGANEGLLKAFELSKEITEEKGSYPKVEITTS